MVSEARSLYIEGFYYSTVALCGVIGENICRTIVESAEITINQKKLENKKPLIRLEFSALNKILIGLNLISQNSYRNLEIIRKLRNDYVHGKTLSNITNAKKDAKISINCIITILKTNLNPGGRMDSIIVRTYKSSQGSIPFYLFLINSRIFFIFLMSLAGAMTLKKEFKESLP